jgi:hypothetical protein
MADYDDEYVCGRIGELEDQVETLGKKIDWLVSLLAASTLVGLRVKTGPQWRRKGIHRPGEGVVQGVQDGLVVIRKEDGSTYDADILEVEVVG